MALDRQRARRSLLLAGALLLASCDEPPTREVEAAQSVLDQARAAGADRYAPERFQEAEAALREARSRVERKDYRGALSSANEAAEKSHGALQQTASAKALKRSATEVVLTEVRAALDEVAAVRAEASAAKVPDAAFAELQPLADAVRQALEGASQRLDQADAIAAQQEALDLKARAAPLPERFREALDGWRAAHPKAKRRSPAVRK